jgi:hypothetical protein
MPSQTQQQSHSINMVPDIYIRNDYRIITQYKMLNWNQNKRFQASLEEETVIEEKEEEEMKIVALA